MKLSRDTVLIGAAAVLIAFSRYALRARVPDDYDSIGFVVALDEFDLAKFQPHFPGYPVYVALGRLAHRVLVNPLEASAAVSAAAAALTSIGLWRLTRARVSKRAAWHAIGLYSVSSLPWLMGGAALSDGTATAFAVVAFALLAEEHLLSSGLILGLMLGVRASYFPLAVSWLIVLCVWRRTEAPKALGACLAGMLLWMVPLVSQVGCRELLELGRTHLTGHFEAWGGSVMTRPDLTLRFGCFARDLVYDGFAPRGWATAELVAAALLGWVLDCRGRRPSRQAVIVGLVLFLPYGLWVLFGQNVVEQPRHVLPLVVMITVGLAIVLERRAALALATMAMLLLVSLPLAIAHARTMPAAAQLAHYVADSYDPKQTALFGGRSIRSVHYLAPSLAAHERTWLSEVDVALERFDVLPRHVLITSEVEADSTRSAHVKIGPLFCRDPRLDRAGACLRLSEYSILEGRAP